MFSDFKNRHYLPSKNKFRLLNDIFSRLSLDDLNERLNHLSNLVDSLDTKIQNFVPIENSFVIFHVHNPEGKELNALINKIPNRMIDNVLISIPPIQIYSDGIFIAYGASDITNHEKKYSISAGLHTFQTSFNNITLTQTINCPKGQTTNVMFNFTRIDANFNFSFSENLSDYPSYLDPFFALVISYDAFHSEIILTGNSTFNFGELNTSISVSFIKTHFTLDSLLFDLTSHYLTQYYFSDPVFHYYQLPTISLLSNSNFQYWFIQSKTLGDYPSIGLLSSPTSREYLNTKNNSFDAYNFIPAYKNYVKLSADIPSLEINLEILGNAPIGSSINGSASQSGSLENIKFSSIPYDFNNDSF